MICEDCAHGGDLTREPAPTLEATRALALAAHSRCRGAGWCPCQHAVPDAAELARRRRAMPRGGLARILDTAAFGGCG